MNFHPELLRLHFCVEKCPRGSRAGSQRMSVDQVGMPDVHGHVHQGFFTDHFQWFPGGYTITLHQGVSRTMKYHGN